MDHSLRCVLALRNRSNIGFRSCLCLCLCNCFLAFFVIVTVPIWFAALGAFLAFFLSSSISFATRPFISSFSSIPRSCSVWPFLACSFACFVSFPRNRTHIVVRHVVAPVLITLYRSRIVRTDTPQIHRYWSVVDDHFVDDDLQLFQNFVEFSSVPSRTLA